MLSNAEIMMGVIHEAQVRQATAHGEHLFTARLAARETAKPSPKGATGWKVWRQLGSSREGRQAR